MIARMGSATARAPVERPEWVKAPLFEQLCDHLAANRRWVILELGSPSSPLFDLLTGHRVRIEIADLHGCGGIGMLNAETDPAKLASIAELVLPAHDAASPVDIVLCWDLLNYLQPSGIAALAAAIEARASRGALAHGLVVYADKEMPAVPGRYRPSPDRRLNDGRDLSRVVPAPRYSPEVLSRTMGNFTIERAMLLANGMQEFLFRL